MNPIRFGESNYNSPYGKDKLQAKTANMSSGANTEVEKDSFNPKYKSKNNTGSVVASIALTTAGVVAAFKNKAKIKDVLGTLKTKLPSLSTVKEFASSHLKSGVEAAKKPIKAIGNFVTNLIHKKK